MIGQPPAIAMRTSSTDGTTSTNQRTSNFTDKRSTSDGNSPSGGGGVAARVGNFLRVNSVPAPYSPSLAKQRDDNRGNSIVRNVASADATSTPTKAVRPSFVGAAAM
eukprot:7711790-Ditylum_brightwellii.AAC.1